MTLETYLVGPHPRLRTTAIRGLTDTLCNSGDVILLKKEISSLIDFQDSSNFQTE